MVTFASFCKSDKWRYKLNSWGNTYISLGGRIVLLNSVLNSVPIFLFVLFEDAGKGGQEGGLFAKKFPLGRGEKCRAEDLLGEVE